MRKRFLLAPFAAAALVTVGGCVTVPTGPSVAVLPGSQKPFEVFRADDADCRQYAYASIGGPAAEQAAANNAVGTAVASTLIGAAAGAAIGSVTGNAGTGAAIGAGSGLLVGSAAGANAGGATYYHTQQRYDTAYMQCMYAKGNQVPTRGYRGGPPPYYSGPAYPYPPMYRY